MNEKHKHAGIVKLHLISIVHKTPEAIRSHNLAIGNLHAPKILPKSKSGIEFGIDEEKYVLIDLTKDINVKGARIKFQRIEGRHKKTIGLQIEKEIME